MHDNALWMPLCSFFPARDMPGLQYESWQKLPALQNRCSITISRARKVYLALMEEALAQSNLARANRDYLAARVNLSWVMGTAGE
jgi:hypothetical protein